MIYVRPGDPVLRVESGSCTAKKTLRRVAQRMGLESRPTTYLRYQAPSITSKYSPANIRDTQVSRLWRDVAKSRHKAWQGLSNNSWLPDTIDTSHAPILHLSRLSPACNNSAEVGLASSLSSCGRLDWPRGVHVRATFVTSKVVSTCPDLSEALSN